MNTAGKGAAPAAISEDAQQQAAEWLTLLMSGEAGETELAAWQRWRDADAEHARAWQHIEAVSQRLGGVYRDGAQRTAAAQALASAGPRASGKRRQLLVWLGVAAGGGMLAAQTDAWDGVRALRADYRTATGERRWVALDDGSKIQLNSASAFDATFSAERRLVHLHRGEMLVNTGVDDRPLWVQTRDGYLRALGSRFLVREEAQGTLLAVQQGAVALFANSREANARHVLKPGEQMLFDHTGIHAPIANGLDPWGWSDGVISAHNMRLDDFLSELSRYRNGLLRCSEAVAGLRVSGTYQLNDTDQVLSLVAQSLPVDVTYRSRYWVTVSPRV